MVVPSVTINRIKLDEIGSVLDIQRICYGEGYLEDSQTFSRMIDVYPQGCLGVSVGGVLVGYVFFHPFHDNAVKPLDLSLVLDGTEDCMYLHDIAVHHRYRGMGLARMLMERVDRETRRDGFKAQCLVAVQNSQEFWEKYGFKTVRTSESYGGSPAHYMKRNFSFKD
jgi:ribosomal protein S18 acetylase RimI-like enzyme